MKALQDKIAHYENEIELKKNLIAALTDDVFDKVQRIELFSEIRDLEERIVRLRARIAGEQESAEDIAQIEYMSSIVDDIQNGIYDDE